MSRRVTSLLVLALLIATASPAAAALRPGGSFLDDDDSIHEADIEAIAAERITRGCNPPDNFRFCPDDAVTREQMAAFLARALDLDTTGTTSPFIDTGDSQFGSEIGAIARQDITRGCNPPANTRFCPEDLVTREQMAAFIVRALGLPVRGVSSPFKDTGDSQFGSEIGAIAVQDITRGCNPPANTRFCPGDLVTREQMASFLTRALELEPITAPDPATFPPQQTSLTQGGTVWATILYGTTSIGDPTVDTLVDLTETIGYRDVGATDCDLGAADALGFPPGQTVYTVSVYYSSQVRAERAQSSFASIGYPSTVAQVRTFCLD